MKLLRRIRSLFRKRKLEAEMDAEMRAHLEMQTERNSARGMPPEEARYAALRQFGNMSSLQERAREARGLIWLEQFWSDLRHGLQSVRKHPGFASVVIGTLALGIGVNLTIASLFSAVLLRPLPGVRDAGELVVLGRTTPRNSNFGNSSYPVFRDFRDSAAPVFSELAAVADGAFSLASDNHSELLLGEYVSENYFATLGVRMATGRAFLPHEDEVPGRNPVVVISHRLWQSRWGGDPSVIGRVVTLNGHAVTIVGVAEPGFKALQLPTAHDVWVPLQMRGVLLPSAVDPLTDPDSLWLRRLVARLAPAVSLKQAQDHAAAIALSLQPTPHPGEQPAWSYRVVGYSPFPAPDKRGPYALFSILIAIALLVLGAVVINAAGLLLSRALGRRREAAVRLALGASRGRLVRQMVAEGLVLAVVAAVLGIAASQFAAEWLVGQIPGEHGDTASLDVVLDWRIGAAAVGLVVLTALTVGLLPAWQGSRIDVLPALKYGEGGQSPGRSRLRSTLVVTQVALSVVLLVCAGLVQRSLQHLEAGDPAREMGGMLIARLSPRFNGYDEARGRELFTRLLERVRGGPAVQHAAMAVLAPYGDGGMSLGPVRGGALAAEEAIPCDLNVVTDAYFETAGIQMLRGRDFAAMDHEGAPGVVIVNRVLADRLWPAQDPLGQLLHIAEETGPRTVVGVVNEDPSVRAPSRPEEPRPYYYLPWGQRTFTTAAILVRANEDPAGMLTLVQSAVRELDSALPLIQVTTLAAARDRTLWQQRLVSWLVIFCSVSAVGLAMVGLHAALAQDVARRTREIGIRVAVGASRHNVLASVISRGMRLTVFGLGAGLLAAFAITRLLRSVLVGVSHTDSLVFTLAPLTLATIAACTCWLPARRAAKVDPMMALRAE